MTKTRYIRIAVVDEVGQEHLAQDVGPLDQVEALVWLRKLVQCVRGSLDGQSREMAGQVQSEERDWGL